MWLTRLEPDKPDHNDARLMMLDTPYKVITDMAYQASVAESSVALPPVEGVHHAGVARSAHLSASRRSADSVHAII